MLDSGSTIHIRLHTEGTADYTLMSADIPDNFIIAYHIIALNDWSSSYTCSPALCEHGAAVAVPHVVKAA